MGPQLTDKRPELGQQVIKVRQTWKRRETRASGGDSAGLLFLPFQGKSTTLKPAREGVAPRERAAATGAAGAPTPLCEPPEQPRTLATLPTGSRAALLYR